MNYCCDNNITNEHPSTSLQTGKESRVSVSYETCPVILDNISIYTCRVHIFTCVVLYYTAIAYKKRKRHDLRRHNVVRFVNSVMRHRQVLKSLNSQFVIIIENDLYSLNTNFHKNITDNG